MLPHVVVSLALGSTGVKPASPKLLNFADLEVRTSRVRCRVKRNMPEKLIPGILNVEHLSLPQKGRPAVAPSRSYPRRVHRWS